MTKIKKLFGIIATSMVLFAMPCLVQAAAPYADFVETNEWEVLKIVNKERIKNGCVPVSTTKSLQQVADIRAKEIASYFSHTRPDGTSCFTLYRAKGVSYYAAGENIAAGQTDPENVMYSWMHSTGHRSNILNNNYTHMGAGYYVGGYYYRNWVQNFVGGCVISSVSLDTQNVKNYAVGTSIEDMNRYLVLDCDMHGKSYMPVISSMCSGYSKDKAGSQTISVKYGNQILKMKVSTSNGDNSSGDNSNGDIGNNSPSSDTNSSNSAFGKVSGLKVTMITSNKIKLKWSKKKCDGYSVYYATSKNGKYKKYKNVSSSQNYCTVKKLKSGKKYYFRVRAFNRKGTTKKYGKYSNKVAAKTL